MKRNPCIPVALIGLLIASLLGGPAAARKVVDYARNSDRVDGFHAVGPWASNEKRAKSLVATNKRGRFPDYIVRTVKAADNASRLNNYPAARFVKTCRDGSLGAYAFVDGSTGADWSEVEGFATLRLTGGPPPRPGFPEDGCSSSIPRARRIGAGNYEIAPYDTSLPCSAMSQVKAAFVSLRDARPLTAAYESSCDDSGLKFVVHVFDVNGTPTDAGFTIALPRVPTVFLP